MFEGPYFRQSKKVGKTLSGEDVVVTKSYNPIGGKSRTIYIVTVGGRRVDSTHNYATAMRNAQKHSHLGYWIGGRLNKK